MNCKKLMDSDTNKIRSKGHVERWQILPSAPIIDCVELLRHDERALVILLRPVEFDGRYLKIIFENALCYRVAPEGLSFNSVELIDRSLWEATFFKVSNSAFVRQFHENSSGAFDDWDITHYAIFTNFNVDVLSIDEPSVTWEENLPIDE